jgi:predicted GIY-YIG superfamily endonuclease
MVARGLGTSSSVLFLQIMPDDIEPPQGWDEIAAAANMSVYVSKKAFAHLQLHGWIVGDEHDWYLDAGLDCDCPKKPPKPRKPRAAADRPRDEFADLRGRTALYRLYNAADVLLYVGITDDLRARMGQHAREQDWWPEVARKTVALYDDREAADRAETLAVAAENPVHNKAKRYAPRLAIEFA